jgi:UDP-N-acetylglucosamine:LPS N-acetylglucosamine transferase
MNEVKRTKIDRFGVVSAISSTSIKHENVEGNKTHRAEAKEEANEKEASRQRFDGRFVIVVHGSSSGGSAL